MSHPILISLSPNTLPRDIRTAAVSLLRPHRWAAYADQLPIIEEQLGRRFGGGQAQLTSSGRAALYEAVRAAGIGAGDEVIIQAFTCLAVPEAIAWAGATPVYGDIDPATYNLDLTKLREKITPRTRAIIIQHTFGIPASMDDILSLAREHHLLIIEDLAHGLGGQYKDRPLGSFGDVAILSFGRDKTISCVFGGAVVSRRPDLMNKIRSAVAAYPLPSAAWVMQQLLHPVLVNLFLPLYFIAGLGKTLLVLCQRLGLLSMAVTPEEKTRGDKPYFIERRFHPALVPLLAEQLKQLPSFTQRRRAIAKRYLQELGGSEYMQVSAVSANWLRFPVRLADKRGVLAAAKRAKILLGDWYASPVAPVTLAQSSLTHYVPGSCPEAERAALHVINLPTHPRMTDEDVSRVIKFIRERQ